METDWRHETWKNILKRIEREKSMDEVLKHLSCCLLPHRLSFVFFFSLKLNERNNELPTRVFKTKGSTQKNKIPNCRNNVTV